MMLMSLKINLKKLYRIQYNGITSFKESRKLKVKVRNIAYLTNAFKQMDSGEEAQLVRRSDWEFSITDYINQYTHFGEPKKSKQDK